MPGRRVGQRLAHRPVGRDPAGHHEIERPVHLLLGVGGHGLAGALGQLARDRGLHGGGEVGLLLLRLKPLGQARGGGLQPREREVEAFAAQQGPRQGEPRAVAAFGQLFQRRAAGIGQAQGLGDLVEGLAGRVVDGRADPAAGADALHLEQLAVPAGDQQQQERIVDRLRQPGPGWWAG